MSTTWGQTFDSGTELHLERSNALKRKGRAMTGQLVPRFCRLLAVVLAALAASEAVRRLVTPPLDALAGSLGSGGRAWQQLPLETVLAGCFAAALALAWAWLLLGGAVVAVDALRRGDAVARAGGSPGLGCPRWVRTLVLAALGLAVSTGPALADAPGAVPTPAAGLAGLGLPDRTVASPDAGPSRRLVRVRPGDTLWAIAARQLPSTAADAAVDRAWRRLAAVNHDRVGDPDLIFPGSVLRVPDLDRPIRKEAP
jgi:hypothetical protein